VTAQAANALLLPVVAGILLLIANSQVIPHPWRNGKLANVLAASIILLVTAIAGTKLAALLSAN